ncbi:hypothetical protein [uncultured Sphingomonas sp.]|uniref:hypothetical protein n=1 Tax=uncultured Sphingomonas sp. TaxID=158754 RepID=UPI0035CAE5B3
MGLNYLLHRHQVSLMNADAAASGEARISHRGLVTGYAQQIDELVRKKRSTSTPLVPLS